MSENSKPGIKRYDIGMSFGNTQDEFVSTNGPWVRYSDHAAAIAERKAQIDLLSEAYTREVERNAALEARLAKYEVGMPGKEAIEEMLCYLQRPNFGLLPPDGGDGALPEYLDALDWLRSLAEGKL